VDSLQRPRLHVSSIRPYHFWCSWRVNELVKPAARYAAVLQSSTICPRHCCLSCALVCLADAASALTAHFQPVTCQVVVGHTIPRHLDTTRSIPGRQMTYPWSCRKLQVRKSQDIHRNTGRILIPSTLQDWPATFGNVSPLQAPQSKDGHREAMPSITAVAALIGRAGCRSFFKHSLCQCTDTLRSAGLTTSVGNSLHGSGQFRHVEGTMV